MSPCGSIGPLDLHALDTPPAFTLSQDQTLDKRIRRSGEPRRMTEPHQIAAHAESRWYDSIGLSLQLRTDSLTTLQLSTSCPELSLRGEQKTATPDVRDGPGFLSSPDRLRNGVLKRNGGC